MNRGIARPVYGKWLMIGTAETISNRSVDIGIQVLCITDCMRPERPHIGIKQQISETKRNKNSLLGQPDCHVGIW
jgi:hypothetical protein